MPHGQPWIDNETKIIEVTPMSIYKQLVAEYMIYHSATNDNQDNMTRRANRYAVKNTWRRYNLHYGRII